MSDAIRKTDRLLAALVAADMYGSLPTCLPAKCASCSPQGTNIHDLKLTTTPLWMCSSMTDA